MSGMHTELDEFTEADRKTLAKLSGAERKRTHRVAVKFEDGAIVETRERREIFSFHAPELGTWLFDVRGIKDAILDGRMTSAFMHRIATIPEHFYQHVLANNGVEPDRIPKVTKRDLKRPGIMVLWPNGYSTMIDGNHRLCRRYQLGLGNFRFLLLNVVECFPFMCRPGDEDRLFPKLERDPRMTTLHREIKIEEG